MQWSDNDDILSLFFYFCSNSMWFTSKIGILWRKKSIFQPVNILMVFEWRYSLSSLRYRYITIFFCLSCYFVHSSFFVLFSTLSCAVKLNENQRRKSNGVIFVLSLNQAGFLQTAALQFCDVKRENGLKIKTKYLKFNHFKMFVICLCINHTNGQLIESFLHIKCKWIVFGHWTDHKQCH